jgi:cell division FtsZ-interacting protein ZapD
MAALIDTAPWIVALERYRAVLFSASGALLALNYWIVLVRPRHCAPGDLCHVDSPFMRFNRRMYWVSLALFVLALTVTYGIVLAIKWMQ